MRAKENLLRERKDFSSPEEAIQFFVSHFEEKIRGLETQQLAHETLLRFLLPFVEANYPNCREMLRDMTGNWHHEVTSVTKDPDDLSKLNKIAENIQAMLHVPDTEKHGLQVITGGKDRDGSGTDLP